MPCRRKRFDVAFDRAITETEMESPSGFGHGTNARYRNTMFLREPLDTGWIAGRYDVSALTFAEEN